MAKALLRWSNHVAGLASEKPSNIEKLSDTKRRRK